jgi:hypothetical protein
MAFNQNLTSVGLTTLTLTVPETDSLCFVEGNITSPTLSDDGGTAPSTVVVTVKQNGTTIYTGLSGAQGFRTTFSGTLGDTIQVIFASSTATDAVLNAVKSTIQFGSGF